MVAATRLTAPLLLGVLVTAGGCSKLRPVPNIEGHPLPPGAETLSLDDIGRSIAEGAARDHWRVEPVAPGRMNASYEHGSRQATVAITYDQTAYGITLVSSSLREADGEIHKRYEKWIRRLEEDIDRSLVEATFAARRGS